MITLKSTRLTALIDETHGATVASLKDRDEWLFPPQSHAPAWPGGGMPLLFPFAGRVFTQGVAGSYTLDGQTRPMPIHGFLYGRRGDVITADVGSCSISFASDADTHRVYPFDWRITLDFALHEETLTTALHIDSDAQNAAAMPCSPGFHPYFALLPDRTWALTSDFTAAHSVTATGDAGSVDETITHGLDRTLDQAGMCNHIFVAGPSRTATLVNARKRIELRASEAFRYFVVWSKGGTLQRGENFYCLEPWCGLPDAVHKRQEAGLIELPPGKRLTLNLAIRLCRDQSRS